MEREVGICTACDTVYVMGIDDPRTTCVDCLTGYGLQVVWFSIPEEGVLNLTQHQATPEQVAAGVYEPPSPAKEIISRLLTFDNLPTLSDIINRAAELSEIAAALATEGQRVMIGGAPFLMSHLERWLCNRGLAPVYAFSKRVVKEEVLPNGEVRKTSSFVHEGFI